MELTTVWFVLIAVLWIGYFVPRGLRLRRRHAAARCSAANDTERRVLINTIGPVWDGNEVWLLVAGGATFAAFPEWYATLFSGFYLPLLLILVALIVRGVAFEYRAKRDDDALAATLGPRDLRRLAACPALLWGVAFANIVRGVPIDADKEYVGSFFDLLNPYALLGGVDHAAALPHPRRDVPRAQDRRRHPAPGPRAWRVKVGSGRGRRRGRLPALDPGRRPATSARRVAFVPRRRPGAGGRSRSRRAAAGRAGRSSAPSSPSRSPWPGCSWRSSPT